MTEDDLLIDRAEAESWSPGLVDTDYQRLLSQTGGIPALWHLSDQALVDYVNEVLETVESPDVRGWIEKLSWVDSLPLEATQEISDPGLSEKLLRDLVRTRLVRRNMEGDLSIISPYREIFRKLSRINGFIRECISFRDNYAEYQWKKGNNITALETWIDIGELEKAAERIDSVCEKWLTSGQFDRLERTIFLVEDDQRSAKMIQSLGIICNERSNFDKARDYLDNARIMFKNDGDLSGEIKCNIHICMSSLLSGEGPEKYQEMLEIVASFTGIDDHMDVMIRFIEAAHLFRARDMYKSEFVFREVHESSKKLGLKHYELKSIITIARCLNMSGKFPEAIDTCEKLIIKNEKDPNIFMAKSYALMKLGMLDDSINACTIALENSRMLKSRKKEINSLILMAQIHFLQEETEKAGHSIEESLLISDKLNHKNEVRAILGLRVEFFILKYLIGEARKNYDEMVLLTPKCDMKTPFFLRITFLLARSEGDLLLARQTRDELQEWAHRLDNPSLMNGIELHESRSPSTLRVARFERFSEPELVIQAMGADRVLFEGREIPDAQWQSARARHLFAYLVHTPEGGTREQLMEVIFPDETGTLAAFNTTLTRVRKALEPELNRGQVSRFLLRSGARYYFNRQVPFDLDTLRFEGHIRRMKAGSGPDTLQAAREAIAAYGGDFLPGVELEWAELRRQRYRGWALEACQVVFDAVCDDPVEAALWIDRALAIDPLDETFNREILLRYLESDNRHLAVKHFNQYARLYRRRLGVDPSRDLVQLFES